MSYNLPKELSVKNLLTDQHASTPQKIPQRSATKISSILDMDNNIKSSTLNLYLKLHNSNLKEQQQREQEKAR